VSGFATYDQARADAADALDRLATAVQPVDAAAAQGLAAHAARARAGRFDVVLLGCFSTGKSTLLNALLGRPVLPSKVNPCTALPTEVRWGETPAVALRYRDGREEPCALDTFLAEWQLQTADDAPGATDRFAAVERAIVTWPLPLLAHGVTLLDTPGLDDDEARTRQTLALLPGADAVIGVLSAARFLSELERRALGRDLAPLGLTNLFFAITMADLLAGLTDDPERERASLDARARAGLGPLCGDRYDDRVFLLDGRAALRARWDRSAGAPQRDPERLAASGILPFEAALERFLVHERGRAQLARLHAAVARQREALATAAALDRATAGASVEELRTRVASLEPRFGGLRAIAARVERLTRAFTARLPTVIWQDLRAFLARSEAELPEVVSELDLGRFAAFDLLTPRGRARVEADLRVALDRWLAGRLASWQASVRPQLEAALGELRAELAADAAAFDALSRTITTDFAGGALRLDPGAVPTAEVDPVERWFAVGLGALLASPATMIAGWAEGYEGALRGAASRIGVRLAVVGLGALLGPVGWVGLALYAVTDAVLLYATGGGQIRRLKDQVAERVRGRLVAQADAARPAIEGQVAAALEPLAEGLVAAAAEEAVAVRQRIDRAVEARADAESSLEAREVAWQRLLAAFDEEGVRIAGWVDRL
jgi:hypothetical protein